MHVITAGAEGQIRTVDGATVHEVDPSAVNRYRSFAARGYPNLAAWLNYSHASYECTQAIHARYGLDVVDSPLWNLDGMVTAVSRSLPVVVRVVTAMKQIADVHGRQSAETEALGELEGVLLGASAGIISNSVASAEALTRVYGIQPHDHVHGIIPYGMVPVSESDVPVDPPSGNGPVTVLFVGRLEKRKGIQDLFAAIPAVLDRHPDVRFTIAGSDNSTEDGFADEAGVSYSAYFAQEYAGYVDRVRFLGFVDEDRLQELYRSCDIFVAPSLYESFGLIYLEAMNFARPVIGCNAGGPRDIIVDGETGLLVPPADPEALGEAISRLVASQDERFAIGQAGRRRLLERYSHTAMATGFVDFYRRVLATRTESKTNNGRVARGAMMEHGVDQGLGNRLTSAEVIRRIRAELGGPSERSSSFAARMAGLRRMHDDFRAEPVGGRLLPLKKLIYWCMASTVDRQSKVVDALFDTIDDLAAEVEQQELLITQLGQELAETANRDDRSETTVAETRIDDATRD